MQAATFQYPRTYRMALWARVLAVVVGVGFCAGGGVLVFLLLDKGRAFGALAVAALLGGGIMAFGAWMVLATLRAKVVLTEDSVAVHGTIGVRRMARADIAGRRLLSLQYGQKMLVLSAKDPRVRDLKIPSSMRTDAAWDGWFAALPDLDVEAQRALEAEVAANAELGQTPEERLARLAAARRMARVVNVATYALAAWGYVYPRPYELALLALGAAPWIAILLIARSSGLFRADTRRGDARPALALPLILPGLVLLMRALRDVGVLDLERSLMFAAAIAALLTWAAVMSDANARARSWGTLLILLFACTYGYGVTVLANARLDSGAGENFRVAVLGRHMSTGRNTTYHLFLDRWGPRTQPQDVSVSAGLYQRSPPGSIVCVHLGSGALGISWYYVGGCAG